MKRYKLYTLGRSIWPLEKRPSWKKISPISWIHNPQARISEVIPTKLYLPSTSSSKCQCFRGDREWTLQFRQNATRTRHAPLFLTFFEKSVELETTERWLVLKVSQVDENEQQLKIPGTFFWERMGYCFNQTGANPHILSNQKLLFIPGKFQGAEHLLPALANSPPPVHGPRPHSWCSSASLASKTLCEIQTHDPKKIV